MDNKNHLFVSSYQSNTVGEYDTTTGATINADFINGQGLRNPDVLLLDGLNHLFVGDNHDTTTVGEYDATTGATINAAFVPDAPGNGTYALALDGSDHLFVAGIDGGVGEYDATTGATINEHLNALNDISGLAVIASVPGAVPYLCARPPLLVRFAGLTSISPAAARAGGMLAARSCAAIAVPEARARMSDCLRYLGICDVYGQLGDGTATNFRNTPAPVSGMSSGVTAVAAGQSHSLAVQKRRCLRMERRQTREAANSGTARPPIRKATCQLQ